MLRLYPGAIITFLVAALVCFQVIYAVINSKISAEQTSIASIAALKGARITGDITALVHKTNAVASLLEFSNGSSDGFYEMASALCDDLAIINIALAPNGIVSDVYINNANNSGNTGFTGTVGNNLLESRGTNENSVSGTVLQAAALARESGRLVISEPPDLESREREFVGILPVFIGENGNNNGNGRFWGFVTILLDFSKAFRLAELDSVENQGYIYRLWRTDPHSGHNIVLLPYNASDDYNMFTIVHVPVVNENWYLGICASKQWYKSPENISLILCGFVLSLSAAYVVQKNYQHKSMESTACAPRTAISVSGNTVCNSTRLIVAKPLENVSLAHIKEAPHKDEPLHKPQGERKPHKHFSI